MRSENLFSTRTVSYTNSLRTLAASAIALFSLWIFTEPAPRAWAIEDVPVAFWAWRASAPTVAEIEEMRATTHARTLFLRAGQIDYANAKLTRIRTIEGTLPANIELHLVYNATEATLDSFVHLDPQEFARLVAATYLNDYERARKDGAHVTGLQLDLDAPTRQLTRYADILRALRPLLPPATQLSITGLPTWMNSLALKPLLAATDFWIPQFYGDRIPRALTDTSSIADLAALRRDLVKARRLNHPFYAGLPAYGYALLYSPRASLTRLRGDLSPAIVARTPHLRFVARRPVNTIDNTTARPDNSHVPTAWRYDFLAEADTVIGGSTIRAGEHLRLEVPTAAGLRLMAQLTRLESGAHLRGICLFRLPSADDPTTLTAREVALALTDRAPHIENALQLRLAQNSSTNSGDTNRLPNGTQTLLLSAENRGTAAPLIGVKAFTVTLRIPKGSLHAVTDFEGFTTSETLCSNSLNGAGSDVFRPCSARRADAVRLSAPTWAVGERATVRLIVGEEFPGHVPSEASFTSEMGQALGQRATLAVTCGN